MLEIGKRSSQLFLGVTVMAIGMAMLPAIATAPQPPQLVVSKLNGQNINILYVTRSTDKVLMRCYPGLQPRLIVRQQAAGTKEGILSCGN